MVLPDPDGSSNTRLPSSFQLDRFIPISRLKYYFAVDTMYVGKKLGLLVFPYTHEVCLQLILKYLLLCSKLWAIVVGVQFVL